jgi:CheY-like chemotaxis protein
MQFPPAIRFRMMRSLFEEPRRGKRGCSGPAVPHLLDCGNDHERIVLHGISGSELAARLRARFPTIKVLFMSGYTEDAVVRQGQAHAAVSFIQKPCTPVSLAKKDREVLD